MNIEFENVNRADPRKYPLPIRSSKGSAGYDFVIPEDACNYELHGEQYLLVPPGGFSLLIRTRVKFKCPQNMYLALHPRNSTGTKKRCRLVNSSGIIDADYYSNPKNDGDIGAVLHNFGSEPAFFAKGEAFMQGIIQKYYVTDNDSTTTLREGATFFGEN